MESISPRQCRMARAALDLGVRDLAALVDMSPNTIARFEREELLRDITIARIRTALEDQGVAFVSADKDAGEGVRLRRTTKSPSDRSGRHEARSKSRKSKGAAA